MIKPISMSFDTAAEFIYFPCAIDQLVETLNDCEMNGVNFFRVGDIVFVDASRCTFEPSRGVLFWNPEEMTWEYVTDVV